MDPITGGLQAVGFAMQLAGVFGGMGASQKNAQISQAIAQQERNINDQKRQQMELSARRQQMEVFRNAQRMRAQGTAAAVNQGAQFGSGLQGGLAQVSDQSYSNSLGIGQNLEIGNNIFDMNNTISGLNAQKSQVQSEAAMYQGFTSLGGSVMSNAGTLGAFGKDIGAQFKGFGTGFGGPYV